MIEGHIIFNAILYSIVIAYILYINFSAYYQTGTGFLRALVNLFQNWIFRTVYLLVVGFFSLDLFPYGGFVLAILLTIAFLNTNMLMYKKDVEESFTNSMKMNQDKKSRLPQDTQLRKMNQPPPPSSLGISSNSSINSPPSPPVQSAQPMMSYSNGGATQAMAPQQQPMPTYQAVSQPQAQQMPTYQAASQPQGQVMPTYQAASQPQGQVMPTYQAASQPQAMKKHYQTGVKQRK